MKYLLIILLSFIVGGCEPPTEAEKEQRAYNNCIDKCRDKYLSSVVIKFSRSRIDNPKGLCECISGCDNNGKSL